MPNLLDRDRMTAEAERLSAAPEQESFNAANSGYTQEQNLHNPTSPHAEVDQQASEAHGAKLEHNTTPHAEVDAATMSRAEIINKCPYLAELVKVDPVKADEYVDKARETGMKEAAMKKQGLSDAEIRKAKIAELRKQREEKKKLDAERKAIDSKEDAEKTLSINRASDDAKTKNEELAQKISIKPEETTSSLGSEDKKNIDAIEQANLHQKTKSEKPKKRKLETLKTLAKEQRIANLVKGINKLGIVRKVIAANADPWKDFNKGSTTAKTTLMSQALRIYSDQKNKIYTAETKSSLRDSA